MSNNVLYYIPYSWIKLQKKKKKEIYKMYFILFSHVTSACFPVSNKTGLTRAKVRAIVVLAVGIRITDGGNNAAFIDICE